MQPISGTFEFISSTNVVFDAALPPSSTSIFSASFDSPVYLEVTADYFPVLISGFYDGSPASCTIHSNGLIFTQVFTVLEFVENRSSSANAITIKAIDVQTGTPVTTSAPFDVTLGWLMKLSNASFRFIGTQEEPIPGPSSAARLFILKTFRRVNARRGDRVIFNSSQTFVINHVFASPGAQSIFELQEIGDEDEWQTSRS